MRKVVWTWRVAWRGASRAFGCPPLCVPVQDAVHAVLVLASLDDGQVDGADGAQANGAGDTVGLPVEVILVLLCAHNDMSQRS
jgi:hypothetical protein